MAMYESEHTRFMREFLEKHPEELDEQRKGRGMWWDKPPQDLEVAQSRNSARVPQKPYYYQPD